MRTASTTTKSLRTLSAQWKSAASIQKINKTSYKLPPAFCIWATFSSTRTTIAQLSMTKTAWPIRHISYAIISARVGAHYMQLGVDPGFLREKLTSRLMTTGGGVGQRRSAYEVPLNVQQVRRLQSGPINWFAGYWNSRRSGQSTLQSHV